MKLSLSIKIYSLLIVLLTVVAACIPAGYSSGLNVSDISMPLCASMGMVGSYDPMREALYRFAEMISAMDGFQGYQIGDLDIREFETTQAQYTKSKVNFYEFDFQKPSKNSELADYEQLVDKDKWFFPVFIRYAIAKIDTNDFLTEVVTYEDAFFFADTDEAKAVRALFHGNWTLKTETTDRVAQRKSSCFRYVPNQQYEKDGDGNVIMLPSWGPTYEEKGFAKLNPNTLMWTTKKNTSSITMVGDTTAIEGADTDHKNVLILSVVGLVFDPASTTPANNLATGFVPGTN